MGDGEETSRTLSAQPYRPELFTRVKGRGCVGGRVGVAGTGGNFKGEEAGTAAAGAGLDEAAAVTTVGANVGASEDVPAVGGDTGAGGSSGGREARRAVDATEAMAQVLPGRTQHAIASATHRALRRFTSCRSAMAAASRSAWWSRHRRHTYLRASARENAR